MLTLTNTQILKLFCISTLIITFLYVNSATASTETTPKTYYVATNGNNNNPGTLAKPWRTISYAADNSIVKPGDTIIIRNGTYNDTIQQRISGSANALITYKNYPNEIVIIDDEGAAGATYRWLILDQSYIKIEGFTFQNNQKGAIEIRTKNTNVSNIQLINNRILDQGSGPGEQSKTIHVTTLETKRILRNILIAGNHFENINNGERPALHLTGQVQDTVVQNNTFSGTSFIALGISGQPSMGQPQNIIIKNNHISGHGWLGGPDSGIYLNGAGNNILIEENILHDGSQGIKVNHESVNKSLVTNNIIIRRNVLYNNGSMNLKMGVGPASANCQNEGKLQNSVAVHNTIVLTQNGTNNWFGCGTNLRWKNNLLVNVNNSNGYQYRLDNNSVDTSSWIINNNFFYDTNLNAPFKWYNKNYSSLNEFITATNHETNAKIGTPGFKDPLNHDYELTSQSHARNAGVPLTTTKNAGSGTSIQVYDALYFTDGYTLQQGDKIIVGSEEVTIISVQYSTHTLQIDRPISWQKDAAVSYTFAESNPDAGAYEYEPILNFHGIPKDTQIELKWNTSIILPEDTNWGITFQPANGQPSNTQTVNLPLNVSSYTITNLPNYELYRITLKASSNGEVLISKTIESFATDIFTYLPVVHK